MESQKPEATIPLSIRLTPGMRELLEKESQKTGYSIGTWVRCLIEKALQDPKKHGPTLSAMGSRVGVKRRLKPSM